MKKRSIAALIALSLTVTAFTAACGADTGAGSGSRTEADGADTADTDEAADDGESDGGAEAGTTAESAGGARPKLVISESTIYEAAMPDGTEQTPFLTGHYMDVALTVESSEEYPELAGALADIVDGKYQDMREEITTYTAEIRQAREEEPDNEFWQSVSYLYERDYYPRRVDATVTSILTSVTSYTGGAHGFTGYAGINLDTRTGETITLPDVIADSAALRAALRERLLSDYDEEEFFDLDASLDDFIEGTYNGTTDEYGYAYQFEWTFDPTGITFYFNPYDVAPYAAGLQTTTVSYDSGLIDAAYIPDDGEGYIVSFPVYFDNRLDGLNDSYGVWTDENYEDGYITGITVYASDLSFSTDNVYAYEVTPYLVVTGGGDEYVYVDTVSDNDYHTLYIYRATADALEFVDFAYLAPSSYMYYGDDETYYRYALTDPEAMWLDTHIDLLSTYNAGKSYYVGENGVPETDDTHYIIGWNMELVSTAEIVCDIVDEGDAVAEAAVPLPSGTTYRLYRTDGESYVDAMLDDGRIARLRVDGADYPQTIDGTPAEELFETLYYAG